jgi:glycosyltransferase involved in cell wall biosynthesis
VENEENIGLTKTLNKGLKICNSEYIARLDADDISHSDRLELQINYLDSNKNIALLGTQIRVINEVGRTLIDLDRERPESPLLVDWDLMFGNPFVHSSVMFRREIICDILGGYNEGFRYNQDFELWSRLLEFYNGANIKSTLVDFRSNPNSITRQRKSKMMKVWQKTLEENVKVQKANVFRVLKDEKMANQWPLMWTELNQPEGEVGMCNISNILVIFLKMKQKFLTLHPCCKVSYEFNSINSDVLLRIARYASLVNRPICIKAYFLALEANFLVSIRAAPAIFSGFIFGKDISNVLRNLKNSLYGTKIE